MLAASTPLTIRTDKTSYHPGESIKISGFVASDQARNNTRIVSIQIQSEDGAYYADERARVGRDNSFFHEVRIPDKMAATGAYRIKLTFADTTSQTSFLIVDDNQRINTPLYTNFFFADIVGLSDRTLSTKRQIRKIDVLNNSIRNCDAFKSTTNDSKFVLPTGDGVAIGFIQGSELPFQLSVQLHAKLREYNSHVGEMDKIRIRIGINAAPVFLVKDLLDRMNVWGDGIILAKRVMDVGNEDHILLSSKVAEDLMTQSEFNRQSIHLIGEYTFKHGEKDVLYSAHGEGFGNHIPPQKTVTGESWAGGSKERINMAYYNKYENSVYFYDKRENLPSFSNLLSYARREIIIAGISVPFDPASQKELFVGRLNEGMEATIILPDPDSRFIRSYQRESEIPVLKERISRALADFRRWREELSNKDAFFIGTLASYYVDQSVIIIDPEDNERAMIQVEYHDAHDSRLSRFEIVFKKKNAAAFNQYLLYYKSLEEKSSQYLYS